MNQRQMAPSCQGGTIYTIRAGDTFFSLAGRFNTTVDAIIAANPDVDPDALEIGQQICIPVPPVPGLCTNGTIYTIRAGDTLFSLANRFNTSVNAILDANPGLDPESLQVGRRICIPVAAPPPTCPGRTYTIRSGDTLFSIARRFGFTLQALLAANPGINPRQLRIGQVICLPPAPSEPVPCPGGTIYVVKAGDTLISIANRFSISLSRLLAANPQITNPDVITIGQSICIPGGSRSECKKSCYEDTAAPHVPQQGLVGPCPLAPCHMCMYYHYCMMYFRHY